MSEQAPTMEYPKAGHVSWNELVATDSNGAKKFYSELFGWKAEPFSPKGAPAGGPPYTVFKMDGEQMGIGGMIQSPQPGVPAHWMPYFVVDNVDAALAKAVKLGARVCAPGMDIGEVGRVAVVQDPSGAVFGLHQFPKP